MCPGRYHAEPEVLIYFRPCIRIRIQTVDRITDTANMKKEKRWMNGEGMSSFNRAVATLRGKEMPPHARAVRPVDMATPRIWTFSRPLTARPEADLCDVLADYLRNDDWDVWFEVPLGPGRPDIIAIRDHTTLAIEGKKTDVKGVIRQGYRILPFVDLAYVALPLAASSEVELELSRTLRRDAEHDRRPRPMFGVLSVGKTVREMRSPTAHPARRVEPIVLRRIADLHGAERGGTPGTDTAPLNLRIWQAVADGATLHDIATDANISESSTRSALRRLARWRDHLAQCQGGQCTAEPSDIPALVAAHRYAEAVLALPPIAGF